MDTSVAGVTVTDVLPEIDPTLAAMLAAPGATAVTVPAVPAALLTVAAAVFDEFQVAWPVRSSVELSVKMPVALNCRVRPLARLGLPGVTWMAVSSAPVTVNVVVPETVPIAAEIVALPTAAALASPPDAAMVATAVFEELQATWEVKSCLELSEKMPVALNCCVSPLAMLGVAGVT